MKSIVVNSTAKHFLKISELEPFQGALKDLSTKNAKKLKQIILDHGFIEPVSIWENNGKKYILNGHQRIKTLQLMESEGYEIPLIPVNFIEAKNEKDAKLKLLALTSQYGKMTQDSLNEFAAEIGLDFKAMDEMFRFPDFKFKIESEKIESEKNEKNEEIQNVVFVICKTENEQSNLFTELQQRGFECKII